MNTVVKVILGIIAVVILWKLLLFLMGLAAIVLHTVVTLAVIALFIYVVYHVIRAANRQKI